MTSGLLGPKEERKTIKIKALKIWIVNQIQLLRMMMKHDILMMGVVSNTENKCLSYEMVMAVKDDDLVK